MPATSAGLPRLFLLRPLAVLMKQTKQAVYAINQSILLRCLCDEHNDIERKEYNCDTLDKASHFPQTHLFDNIQYKEMKHNDIQH